MNLVENIKKPTKEEKQIAKNSFESLIKTIEHLDTNYPEIKIGKEEEAIKIPRKALELLAVILKDISQGKPVSIVPISTEITTQAAAEILGCSRPHVIKLLESGEINYTKIGKHRRIKYQDIMDYKRKMKARQRKLLTDMMNEEEEIGVYDSN